VGALLSALLAIELASRSPCSLSRALFAAMLVAVAASNADTWAVEVGTATSTSARLITKPWIEVPAGTSGGISLKGEAAAALGSLAIAAISSILYEVSVRMQALPWSAVRVSALELGIVVFLFGWLGELVDSLVGATLQGKYYCPRCGVWTERSVHECGTRAVLRRGFRLVSNEVTNLIATGTTSILAFCYALLAM